MAVEVPGVFSGGQGDREPEVTRSGSGGGSGGGEDGGVKKLRWAGTQEEETLGPAGLDNTGVSQVCSFFVPTSSELSVNHWLTNRPRLTIVDQGWATESRLASTSFRGVFLSSSHRDSVFWDSSLVCQHRVRRARR